MNERRFEPQHALWLICFSLVSWFIFSGLFMSQKIFDFLYELQADESELSKLFDERELPVIITNPNIKEKKEDPIEKLYRSDQASEAQGKFTKEKGFHWLSEQDRLKLRNLRNSKEQENKEKSQEDTLTVRIIKNIKLLWQRFKKKKEYSELSRIPDSYRFDYKRAFSWDKNGTPLLPAYLYKHYNYIKAMINKIRYHWAPPGGSPWNIYQTGFYRGNYVPGYIQIRIFPPQEIALVFMLDQSGDVIDIKIEKSMGYKSLDESFVEAIRNAQNFGPPPKDFIRLNRAIFPWLFKIY